MESLNQRHDTVSHRSGRRPLTLASACAVMLALGLGGWHGLGSVTDISASSAAPAQAVERRVGGAQDSYADLVDEVSPAVVTIRSERRVQMTQQQFPFSNDPFFREFFGERFRQAPQMPQERRQSGLGSGVIVSADGYILTNHHVISGAEAIKVELTDRRTFDATLVGSDPPSDLAVLKIDAANLRYLSLGDSDQVRVGDVVLAIGNPLGVGQTVTMGIISAKGRATGLGDGSFEDFLQTDAPINRGNSGGALVNTRGELIGINSQILSPSGGNIGIGFAIPASMARNVMTQLIDHGEVRRGLLGVTVQPVTSDIAASLGISEIRGALVNQVQPGSPAEKAGIRRGDVIIEMDGTPISDSNSLRNHIAAQPPGSEAKLTVVRDGRTRTLTAQLGELPGDRRAAANDQGGEGESTSGLSVEPLTEETAERLGLRGVEGVRVTRVDPSGAAASAGIRADDVIEEVNGSPVRSAAELKEALGNGSDRPALVLVNRDGTNLFLTLTPRQT